MVVIVLMPWNYLNATSKKNSFLLNLQNFLDAEDLNIAIIGPKLKKKNYDFALLVIVAYKGESRL